MMMLYKREYTYYFPIEWYCKLPDTFDEFMVNFNRELKSYAEENNQRYDNFIYARNNVTAVMLVNDIHKSLWMKRIKIENDDRDDTDGYKPPLPFPIGYDNYIQGDLEELENLPHHEDSLYEEENLENPENFENIIVDVDVGEYEIDNMDGIENNMDEIEDNMNEIEDNINEIDGNENDFINVIGEDNLMNDSDDNDEDLNQQRMRHLHIQHFLLDHDYYDDDSGIEDI